MSLLDLFRPKWKHSSEVVRLEAVATIRDPALLARIATEDRDWRVACKAVEGLNDPSRLASLARFATDHRIRIAALRKLNDTRVIVAVARDDREYAVREAAFARVEDPNALAQIAAAHPNPDVRKQAIARIEDPNVLTPIATTDSNPALRKAATARITDSATLAAIIENDRDRGVRATAARGLGDRTLAERAWATLAKRRSPEWDSLQAVKEFVDLEILAELLTAAEAKEARQAAAERLVDAGLAGVEPTLLAQVANTRELPDAVRLAAVDRIEDQPMLWRLAEDTGEAYSRVSSRAAERLAGRLPDQNSLARLVAIAQNIPLRQKCLALISDQDLLLQIARSNSDPSIRLRAAERIADAVAAQALFSELATSPIEPRFGRLAVAHLQDQARLVEVVHGQAPLETRLEAVKKIADQAILADLGLRHEERLVRVTAASTLTDPQVLARLADTAPAGKEVEVVKAADNWDAGDGTWIEKEFVPDAREAARARLAALAESTVSHG